MKKSLAALGAAALGLMVAETSPAAQQIYFKNARVMEVSSYEIKGPLIYLKLTDGSVVIMREATVDWEGTSQLVSPDIVLRQGEYEQPAMSQGAGTPLGRGTALTATTLKSTRGALRRAAASRSGHTMQVYASRGWSDTGVDVRGQDLVVLASGRAHVSPELGVGPAGESSGVGRGTPLIPSFPFGALIGKIGDAGTPFLVGSRLNLATRERGRLYLTVNDRNTADNKGSFEIDVQAAGAMPSGSSSRGSMSGSEMGGSSAASASEPAPARQGLGRGIDKARSMRESLPKQP